MRLDIQEIYWGIYPFREGNRSRLENLQAVVQTWRLLRREREGRNDGIGNSPDHNAVLGKSWLG